MLEEVHVNLSLAWRCCSDPWMMGGGGMGRVALHAVVGDRLERDG